MDMGQAAERYGLPLTVRLTKGSHELLFVVQEPDETKGPPFYMYNMVRSGETPGTPTRPSTTGHFGVEVTPVIGHENPDSY